MKKSVLVSIVALSVLIADQLTKSWIRATVEYGSGYEVVDGFFRIVHARNPGGAFSFLAGMDEAWRIPFFLVTATIAISALIYFLRQVEPQQRLLQIALAGILGGALGNLIDRVTLGYVTDFLDVYVGDAHWPAFNVADSFISVGVVVMFIYSFFAPAPAAETPERAT